MSDTARGFDNRRRQSSLFIALALTGGLITGCSGGGGNESAVTTTTLKVSFSALVADGINLINAKKYASAVTVLEQAALLEPTSPLGYYDLALAYEDEGEPRQALVEYEQALVVDPTYVSA